MSSVFSSFTCVEEVDFAMFKIKFVESLVKKIFSSTCSLRIHFSVLALSLLLSLNSKLEKQVKIIFFCRFRIFDSPLQNEMKKNDKVIQNIKDA